MYTIYIVYIMMIIKSIYLFMLTFCWFDPLIHDGINKILI